MLDNQDHDNPNPNLVNPINNNPNVENNNMVSKEEFKRDASKALPDYDGNSESFQRFIDALDLLSDDVGDHEVTAIKVIKTKLIGKARSCITDRDNTIALIRERLIGNITSESSDVLIGKLMNSRQGSKSANSYVDEITKLTDSFY